MKFDKSILISTLDRLGKTSAKNSAIPALSHVFFDGKFAFTYDGFHLSRVPFESEFQITAPYTALFKFANHCKKDIRVKIPEDSAPVWSSGGSRAKFESIPLSAWTISMSILRDIPFFADEAGASAIRLSIPKISEVAEKSDDKTYSGMLVLFRKKTIIVCATNNICAGMAFVEGNFERRDHVIIPYSFSKVLLKSIPDCFGFYVNPNWFGVRLKDDSEVFTKLIDGTSEHHGFELMKTVEWPATKLVVDDEFVEALKTLKEIPDCLVTIHVENGYSYLTGKGKSGSEMTIQLGDIPQILNESGDVIPFPDCRMTFDGKSLWNIISPDSEIFIIEDRQFMAVNSHGAQFLVSAAVSA